MSTFFDSLIVQAQAVPVIAFYISDSHKKPFCRDEKAVSPVCQICVNVYAVIQLNFMIMSCFFLH